MTLTMSIDKAYNQLRPLYVIAQFNGQPISNVLVDNKATLNVLSISILNKISKKKCDILPTILIMTNFLRVIARLLRVLLIEHIVGCRMTETTFFVLDAVTTYNSLLD